MDEAYKKQAGEWFERGRHDIETAQLLYEQKGYIDIIAYHIHQAIEKYLKGYLVLHGKKPAKIHELDTLLYAIAAFDPAFLGFREFCEKASRFYIEARYPPGPPVDYGFEEIEIDLKIAWNLVERIESKL